LIIVIPCGAAKRKQPSPAYALYQGSYFKACLLWALSVSSKDRVFILSAKHGLLRLTDVVAPYDLKMGQPGSITPSRVREQAQALGVASQLAVVLGGSLYVSCARQAFERSVALVECMTGPTGMGHQIGWLKKNRRRIPEGIRRLDVSAIRRGDTPCASSRHLRDR
jgi:hypothetical protein